MQVMSILTRRALALEICGVFRQCPDTVRVRGLEWRLSRSALSGEGSLRTQNLYSET